MTTPILKITEAANGQVDQYLTYNEALRALESSTNNFHVVDMSAGNVTLTDSANVDPALNYIFSRNQVFRTTGNTVSRVLTVPQSKRLFVVQNGGTFALTVKRGTTEISLDASLSAIFYSDGTANGLSAVSTGSGSGGGVSTIVAGDGIDVDNTDPANPIVSATGGGGDVVGPAASADNEIALFDGASGKSLKRGPVVGTAASANLVTSSNDTTAGRVPTVGWMGIGAAGNIFIANPNDVTFNGLWRGGGTSALGAYPAFLHMGDSAINNTQIGGPALIADQLLFRKKVSGVWQTAYSFWHTGNLAKTTSATDATAGRLLKVGDGGLLSSTAPSFPGFNVAKTIGWYQTNAIQDFAGAPAGASGSYIVRLDAANHYTLYQNTTLSGAHRIYHGISGSPDSAPVNWIEYIHTGNTSAAVQTMLGAANNSAIRSAISASSLPPYTLGTVPSAAANANLLIVITDLTGGREPCFSDGTNWLRCSDKTIAD